MSQLNQPGTLGFFQHTPLNTLSRPIKTATWCILNRKETRALGLSTPIATLSNSHPYLVWSRYQGKPKENGGPLVSSNLGAQALIGHQASPSPQGGRGRSFPQLPHPIPSKPLNHGEEAIYHLCGLIKVIVRIF